MSTITHRVGLGRNLTGPEVDANFDSLKADVDANTTALASKVPTTRSINGHPLSADVTITKGDVGLSNVDNTSDAAKPISTAQAAVNALKADLLIAEKTVSTTTYTVIESDKKKTLIFTHASGCLVTHPVGLSVGHAYKGYVEIGAGNVTLQGDGTSTVVSKSGSLVTNGAKSTFVVEQKATNVFTAEGDLGALSAADVYAAVLALLAQGTNVTLTGNGTTITVSSTGGSGTVPDFSSGNGNYAVYPQYPGSATFNGVGPIFNVAPTGGSAPTVAGVTLNSTNSLGGKGYNSRFRFTAAATTDYILWKPSSAVATCPGTDPIEPIFRFSTVFTFMDLQAWSGSAGARSFIGVAEGAALTNSTEPSANLTNAFGYIADSNEQYFKPFCNSGAANAGFKGSSLGAGFEVNPAPASYAAAPAYVFGCKVTPGAGDNRKVDMYLYNRTSNTLRTDTFTATSTGGKMPVTASSLFPVMFRCNNGGATPVAAIIETTGMFGGAYSGVA